MKRSSVPYFLSTYLVLKQEHGCDEADKIVNVWAQCRDNRTLAQIAGEMHTAQMLDLIRERNEAIREATELRERCARARNLVDQMGVPEGRLNAAAQDRIGKLLGEPVCKGD